MIWRGLFVLAGLAVIGIEAWGTWEFLYADQRAVNYIVVGGCFMTVLSGLLPAAAGVAWEDRRPVYAVVAWLLVPLSLSVMFMATISRTGGAADRAQAERTQAARTYKEAQKTVAELERTLQRQEATAEYECAPAQKGRGMKCTDANKDVAETQAKLVAAREKLVKAPAAEQVDSLSVRIEAVTGGRVTQDQARMFQPAILPIIMSLVGAVLVAIGARKPRQPKPAKQKEAAAQKLEPAKAPEPARALEPVKAAVVEPPKQIAAPQKNVVPIVKPKPAPVGSVAQFFVERCEPADGSMVAVADLLAAYRQWCAGRGAQPVSTPMFAQQLEAVAGKVGIPISATPGGPTCENVRLAS